MNKKKRLKGNLKAYLQWPVILSIWTILANIIVFAIDFAAGAVMSVFTLTCLIASVILFLTRRPRIFRGMTDYAMEFAQVQRNLLAEMKIPYGIMDEKGKLLWLNKELSNILSEEKNGRKNISAIFPDFDQKKDDEQPEEDILHVEYKEHYYRLYLKKLNLKNDSIYDIFLDINMEDSGLTAVYLFDETEITVYQQKIMNQQMVAGLIYLDNYEEALESVEEVRRSLLAALIDRKINKYVNSLSGIVKKIEKDKYFIVIKQQYIDKLREERFSLLEEVKTVNIGNERAVTLSIGMGMNGETYIQNYEYARIAIDMALGRGGDQAVVKDGEKIFYFGGKSQRLEKTTRVKARVKAHAMRELMADKDRLLIMGHKLGDVDSFGAAVGIYRIAISMNKKANIIINDVTSSVRPLMDRFIRNAEYGEDMFITDSKAAELADVSTMLVVVDVNKPSYTEAPELLKVIKTIVVLDHHRQGPEVIENATLSYVEPYASSACEMVAEILQYIADGIRVKPAEADAMYAGIVIDTNNFMNKTGVRTFEAAAFLKRSGADTIRVRKMFRDKMSDYKARAEAVRNAEVFEGAFAISICPCENVESPMIIGAQAANELLDIIGIKASIVLTEYNDTIYISARSIDEINVQIIMERLGGGGHMTVAGAQLKGTTPKEAKQQVQDLIKQMQQEGAI